MLLTVIFSPFTIPPFDLIPPVLIKAISAPVAFLKMLAAQMPTLVLLDTVSPAIEYTSPVTVFEYSSMTLSTFALYEASETFKL